MNIRDYMIIQEQKGGGEGKLESALGHKETAEHGRINLLKCPEANVGPLLTPPVQSQ